TGRLFPTISTTCTTDSPSNTMPSSAVDATRSSDLTLVRKDTSKRSFGTRTVDAKERWNTSSRSSLQFSQLIDHDSSLFKSICLH
ncbi:hypothetical protein PENTCL1PPCAC_24819, partial [Pristionchus entomophagus]